MIFRRKSFAIPKNMLTFALAKRQCPDGGIGRRAGLKHQWSNPSRFDPGSGYKELQIERFVALFFAYDIPPSTSLLYTITAAPLIEGYHYATIIYIIM